MVFDSLSHFGQFVGMSAAEYASSPCADDIAVVGSVAKLGFLVELNFVSECGIVFWALEDLDTYSKQGHSGIFSKFLFVGDNIYSHVPQSQFDFGSDLFCGEAEGFGILAGGDIYGEAVKSDEAFLVDLVTDEQLREFGLELTFVEHGGFYGSIAPDTIYDRTSLFERDIKFIAAMWTACYQLYLS